MLHQWVGIHSAINMSSSVGVGTTSHVDMISIFPLALLLAAKNRWCGPPTIESATLSCPCENVGSSSLTPIYLLFDLDRYWWSLEKQVRQGTGAGYIQLIAHPYAFSYHGDEYYLSSIVVWGDHSKETDIGGIIMAMFCTIANFMPGREISQKYMHYAIYM